MAYRLGRVLLTTPHDVIPARRRDIIQEAGVSGHATPTTRLLYQTEYRLVGTEYGSDAQTVVDALEKELGRVGAVHVEDEDAKFPKGYYALGPGTPGEWPRGAPTVRPWEVVLTKQPSPRVRFEAEDHVAAGSIINELGNSEDKKVSYTPTTTETPVLNVGSSLVLALRLEETGGTDGANLVANPGFETYTTTPGAPDDWAADGTGTLEKETTIKRSGANSVKITGDGVDPDGVRQNIAGLTVGRSYYVEAWARTGGAANEQAYLILFNTTDLVEVKRISGTVATTTFEKFALTFEALAGKSYRLILRVQTGFGAGKVAYWDDTLVQEIQAKDASAFANHGVLKTSVVNVAGPTIGAVGKLGNAFDFDGADDYVETLNNVPAVGTKYSLEAWLKKDVAGVTRVAFHGPIHVYIGSNTADGRATFSFKDPAGVQKDVIGGTALVIGALVHVIGTHDGTTGRLYMNGVQVDSLASANQSVPAGKWFVGEWSVADNRWDGPVDEPRLYNRTLTADEAKKRYDDTVGGARPAHDYKVYIEPALDLPEGSYKIVARAKSLTTFTQKFRARFVDKDGATIGSAPAQVTNTVAGQFEVLTLTSSYAIPAANHRANHLIVEVQGIAGQLNAVELDYVEVLPA